MSVKLGVHPPHKPDHPKPKKIIPRRVDSGEAAPGKTGKAKINYGENNPAHHS